MTNPTPLSAAAYGVLTAVTLTKYDVPPEGLPAFAEEMAPLIAAALRAAADLMAPDDYKCFTGHLDWDLGMEARNDTIRENLLAIAAELDGTTPTKKND